VNKQLITKEQIKLIKTVQRKHQGDDDYYEMLEKRFRVSSCTQLTMRQASALIKLYIGWGWAEKRKRGRRSPQLNPLRSSSSKNLTGQGGRRRKTKNQGPMRSGNMVRMASPAQRKKIDALANLIDWRVKDGLTKWIAKRFSIQRIKTAQEAYQVIEGLKKMFERVMKEEYGDAWMERVFEDPQIQRYIEEHAAKWNRN
jgi:uncharacterized protein DUF1018